MDRRLITSVSLALLLAGCVRPQMRSAYDPFSPPKQLAVPATQPTQAGGSVTIDAPGVVNGTPAELRVTVGSAVAGQVKQVRLTDRPAHVSSAKANWTATEPVTTDANGIVVAVVALPTAQRGRLPEGYSILTAEALDADGSVIASSTKVVVNAGSVVRRSTRMVQGAGLPLLARNEPYRAAAWLGAAATIDRLKTAIAHDQVADVGRLAQEVQTRIDLLSRDARPTVDRALLHDLLVLGHEPRANVIVEYPAADHGVVTFNCGPIPMVAVDVQQSESEDAAKAVFDQQLANVPTKKAPAFRQPTKFSTVWLGGEWVDPAKLDMHDELILWNVDDKEVLGVVSAEEPKDIKADAVIIDPRAHSQPAKAAAVYAQQQGLPTVTMDDLAGAKRILIAADVRSDGRFAGMRYRRVTTHQGGAVLYVLDGKRVLWGTASTLDAASEAIKLVHRGRPVTEAQTDWLRRTVVQGIDRSVKARYVPVLCGDLGMHRTDPESSVSPTGRVLEAMYSLQDFTVVSDPAAQAEAQQAGQALTAAGVRYPLISQVVVVGDAPAVGEQPERVVVFTANPAPESLALAVANGEAVGVVPNSQTLFVGKLEWMRRALGSLADAEDLKKAKAQRIQEMLQSARIGELLNGGQAQPATQEAMK